MKFLTDSSLLTLDPLFIWYKLWSVRRTRVIWHSICFYFWLLFHDFSCLWSLISSFRVQLGHVDMSIFFYPRLLKRSAWTCRLVQRIVKFLAFFRRSLSFLFYIFSGTPTAPKWQPFWCQWLARTLPRRVSVNGLSSPPISYFSWRTCIWPSVQGTWRPNRGQKSTSWPLSRGFGINMLRTWELIIAKKTGWQVLRNLKNHVSFL